MERTLMKNKRKTHDRKVREIARKLQKQGWKVKADLPGYPKPSPIGKKKHIPDIEATKGGKRQIIEVETPQSLRTDKEQITTFKQHASHREDTEFKLIITRPKKHKHARR